jgi:hypothetical protein
MLMVVIRSSKMSEIHDDGGAAFPVVHPDGSGVQYFGIGIRDYFAAKALQGMICAEFASVFNPDDWAQYSYKIADAMLTARNKESAQ